MYHPYQNEVASQIMKERRGKAEMSRRVSQARANHAQPRIPLPDRLASLVGGFSDWVRKVQDGTQTRVSSVPRASAPAEE